MKLSAPIKDIKGVAKTAPNKLKRLGIKNIRDFLFFFPFRYEDYSQTKKIKDLVDGETITIKTKIIILNNKRSFKSRRMITEGLVSDESGSMRIAWFNQSFVSRILKVGDEVYFSGKVKFDMLGAQLANPLFEKVDKINMERVGRLVPVYHTTAGLTQKQFRFILKNVIAEADQIKEWIPDDILEKNDLILLSQALAGIHEPKDKEDLNNSLKRLKFGELFRLQLKAKLSRLKKEKEKARPIKFKEKEVIDFVGILPFKLTNPQRKSSWEILQDMERDIPMNRLLSGDVGSGKTIVAGTAIFNTILNNRQAIFLAPTEILVRQHYDSLVSLFGHKFKIGLLSRSQMLANDFEFKSETKAGQKREFFKLIEDGGVDIVLGTHALLSDKLSFKNVGLVVVDEQHRFGVNQRKLIKEKAGSTHFLSMTATPIPRSLALVIYGDLEVSLIDEMPVGRKKILTRLVEPANRQKAYDFIKEKIKQGQQAFVICPLIGEGTSNGLLEKKSVLSEYEKLSKQIFPEFKIDYLHGKLSPEEKESKMADFKNNKINILVATSVVEVGIDIPNASIMIIEDADRFGLAQLHQFRGRVGRGEHQSYCFLFTNSESEKSMIRLKFFESHNNGFELSEEDLKTRGPGEVYGTSQSGEMMSLRLARLSDRELIKLSRSNVEEVVENKEYLKFLKDFAKNNKASVHFE